jgi:sulfur-carrier protein
MAIHVLLPLPLVRFTGGQGRVSVENAADIEELVDALDRAFPGIKSRLANMDTGELLPYIHYFINGKNARSLGEGLFLQDGDEVAIIPAIAGG